MRMAALSRAYAVRAPALHVTSVYTGHTQQEQPSGKFAESTAT